jgi:hypothetical protein
MDRKLLYAALIVFCILAIGTIIVSSNSHIHSDATNPTIAETTLKQTQCSDCGDKGHRCCFPNRCVGDPSTGKFKCVKG